MRNTSSHRRCQLMYTNFERVSPPSQSASSSSLARLRIARFSSPEKGRFIHPFLCLTPPPPSIFGLRVVSLGSPSQGKSCSEPGIDGPHSPARSPTVTLPLPGVLRSQGFFGAGIGGKGDDRPPNEAGWKLPFHLEKSGGEKTCFCRLIECSRPSAAGRQQINQIPHANPH